MTSLVNAAIAGIGNTSPRTAFPTSNRIAAARDVSFKDNLQNWEVAGSNLDWLQSDVIEILKAKGTDCNVFLPGVGILDGLTAGNYLDSAGTTAATVDNPVGLVVDANGAISATQATTANKPILRKGAVNLLTYSEQFDNAAWSKGSSFVQSNLLLQSEDFDNASWAKTGLVATLNDTTAPTGTNVAEKLTLSGLNTEENAIQSIAVTAGTSYTFSAYLKAGTRSNVALGMRVSSLWPSSLNQIVDFNLSNGTATINSGSATFSITNVGNSWYRCTITSTAAASGTAQFRVQATSSAGETTYFYAWGAQLVQGAVAGDYVRTSSTVMPVMYQAPNNTLSADKLVEDSATAAHFLQSSALTAQSGTAYTFSCYAKAGERSKFELLGFALGLTGRGFDLSNGTTFANTAGLSEPTSFSITSVGNGWYRCSITANGNGLVSTVRAYLNNGTTFSYAGNGTSGIYIWGAQLEQGSTASTYAPTTTAPASNLVGGYHWVADSTDLLTATYPAGYESATIVNALAAGQQTLPAQNIVGAYSIGPSVDTYGRFVFRTGLTASELTTIQQYANRLAGV